MSTNTRKKARLNLNKSEEFPNEGKRWSEKDNRHLQVEYLFNNRAKGKIAKELGRSFDAIDSRIQAAFRGERLFPVATEDRSKVTYSPHEDKFIKDSRMCNNGKEIRKNPVSWEKIAEQLGRSGSAVRDRYNVLTARESRQKFGLFKEKKAEPITVNDKWEVFVSDNKDDTNGELTQIRRAIKHAITEIDLFNYEEATKILQKLDESLQ